MLVSTGAALFVVACLEWGMHSDAISRVIQELVTGIGFLGAGSILKKAELIILGVVGALTRRLEIKDDGNRSAR